MKSFKNHVLLYVVFGANTTIAITNGIDWSYWVIFALTAVLFTLDLMEALLDGRK